MKTIHSIFFSITILISCLSASFAGELPADRLYTFTLGESSMVCQFAPNKMDTNIETGTATFWKLGTGDYWSFPYTDNGMLVHMDGLPGYFFHISTNDLQYVLPGGFTMRGK